MRHLWPRPHNFLSASVSASASYSIWLRLRPWPRSSLASLTFSDLRDLDDLDLDLGSGHTAYSVVYHSSTAITKFVQIRRTYCVRTYPDGRTCGQTVGRSTITIIIIIITSIHYFNVLYLGLFHV